MYVLPATPSRASVAWSFAIRSSTASTACARLRYAVSICAICVGVRRGWSLSQDGLSETPSSLKAGVRGACSPGKSAAFRGAGAREHVGQIGARTRPVVDQLPVLVEVVVELGIAVAGDVPFVPAGWDV